MFIKRYHEESEQTSQREKIFPIDITIKGQCLIYINKPTNQEEDKEPNRKITEDIFCTRRNIKTH